MSLKLIRFDACKAGFGYDNSVSLQTTDAGHMCAAVLADVACVVGLQTDAVVVTETRFTGVKTNEF